MADYINKSILCQAYIHIEPDNLSEEKHEQYFSDLSLFAEARAKFFLYPEVETDVSSKEGSLITYVTIAGTLSALYVGVSQYPDFRAGAIALFEDVKRLAEVVVSEGLFSAKAKRGEIIRVEARTGIVGSLRKIITEYDAIQKHNGIRSEKWMAERLAVLANDSAVLLSNVNAAEDKEFLRKGIESLAAKLPTKPSPPRGKLSDSEYVGAYVAELKELKELLSENSPKKLAIEK